MGNRSNSHDGLNRIAFGSLAIVVAICALTLTGWLFDRLTLASIGKSFIPMAPNTAIFFLVLCGTLFTQLRWPDPPWALHLTRWSALLVGVASVTIFADYLIDAVDLNIEGLFFYLTGKTDLNRAGRMSPITAGAFAVAACALFFLSISHRKNRLRLAASLLACIVSTTGLVLLIGYLEGSPFLYGGAIIPVAFPTAVAFLVLGLGICAANGPEAIPQRLFLGSSIRAYMMRAFLPVTVALVLFQGLLAARLYTRLVNPSLLSSLMTLLSLTIVTLLIAAIAKTTSNKIGKAERKQKLAELKLSESEELFRSFYENTIDAMFVGSPEGTIYAANPEACRIFGMGEEELRGAGWVGIVDRDQFQSALGERMRTGSFRGELVCKRKNGTLFPAELSSSVFTDKSGQMRTTVTLRDITQRNHMEKELRETNAILKMLSNTDPLTHLYNRRYLMDSLEKELNRQRRNRGHLTLVLFDVDHFKNINDAFGHRFGDTVLVAIAESAREHLRSYEFAARYGGEEFVLLLPQTDLEGGVVVAERLREAVQALTFDHPFDTLAVTVSVGVATFPAPSVDSIDQLITKADEALYRAKRAGRNRVEIMSSVESR